MRIAIIADPHIHDAAFDWRGDGAPSLRTLADTIGSTRVFNESGPAARAALDDIAARGISIVIVPGDLTDDGQRHARDKAIGMLQEYSVRHGMRFFATVGNHDLFACAGRHHAKRLLNPDGSHDLVTSDAQAPASGEVARIVSEAMYCPGYDETIPAMAELGFMRQARDLHWESPFGTCDDLNRRRYEVASDTGVVRASMIDASYLVEPVEGLWLLSLDANVYRPADDGVGSSLGFVDDADAGWNAAIKHKRFLLDWIAGVTQRATAQGKQLIAFSHYPVVDPLSGTYSDELALFGKSAFALRMPLPEVSEQLSAAGLRCHFSGHWHVNNTARFESDTGYLVNISMPSPVGFPAAYKIAEIDAVGMSMQTIPIREVEGFDLAFAAYAREAQRTGMAAGLLLGAADHFEFISRHLALLVRDRYLPREWPAALQTELTAMKLAEVATLGGRGPLPAAATALGQLPFFEMIVDWYRLRKGGDVARQDIDATRLAAYRALIDHFAIGNWPDGSMPAQLAIFMRMLGRYLACAPSADFHIDRATGTIAELAVSRPRASDAPSSARSASAGTT